MLQERDRLQVEKTSAREAAAEAKRSKMLEAADRARLARERSGQERENNMEREAAAKRATQTEAARCEGGQKVRARSACKTRVDNRLLPGRGRTQAGINKAGI